MTQAVTSSAMTTTERLHQLRALFSQNHITAYFIPKANAFGSEYLSSAEERLCWLTGFSGSAGCCLVLEDKAFLFVDGRYVLQAAQEVDPLHITVIDMTTLSFPQWLGRHGFEGLKIGADPWLITTKQRLLFAEKLAEQHGTWLDIQSNLVDILWLDRPTPSHHPARLYPLSQAGVPAREKLTTLATMLREKNTDYLLLCTAESVNWLLNVRGQDLEFMPVLLAYAVVDKTGQTLLFTDLAKISSEIQKAWQNLVEVKDLTLLSSFLESAGAQHTTLMIDPAETPWAVCQPFEDAGGDIVNVNNPTLLPKACKNPVEQTGMIAAHQRDGLALTLFLQWVQENALDENATEITAAQKLAAFRRQQKGFWGESFPTISAVGAHGAIIHYRATPQTESIFNPHHLYLIDSGGHYEDGSTDVTRTVALGPSTAYQQDCFTTVLKGHIALARVVFPHGTTGSQLDVLARQFLWQQGRDYAHSTGHGVGFVLSIHEGPQNIGKNYSSVPLQPGMIVSNEPGYYEKNAFGIRIENLMMVEERSLPGATLPLLGFKTLTLAPLDRSLIELSQLEPVEIQWINDYHQDIYRQFFPLMTTESQKWLRQVTSPL